MQSLFKMKILWLFKVPS